MQTLTFSRLIADRARRAPGALAIDYPDAPGGGSRLTYAALDRAARRTARGLSDLGVAPGDRVALWLPNVPAWLVLFAACARIGAIAVALNTRFRAAEIEDVIARAGVKVLALWPGFRDIGFLDILAEADPPALSAVRAVILYDEDGEGGAAPPLPAALARARAVSYRALAARPPLAADRAAPDQGCAIFTTSGTTSRPKFVLHHHHGVVRHALDVARAFDLAAPGSVALQALPLGGVFGFCQATATLAAGRPTVLTPSFEAERAAALVRTRRITHMNATDGMVRAMLAARREAQPFPSLRRAGFAAFAPGGAAIVGAAEARALRLFGLYGMSEIQALFARQRADDTAPRRARAGGWPSSPEAAVRIRDPESGRLVGPGVRGEIEAAGPSLMAGYFGDPAASEAVRSGDGFIRTGDLGYIDDDGALVFESRMGDALRLGGFLVNPAEIEAFVAAHPAVAGCQVVAVPVAGALRPVAFVTLAGGADFDEAALIAHCAGGMAAYKRPLRIAALEAFPVTRSANGVKVRREVLRSMAAALVGDGAADDPGRRKGTP